MDADTPQSFLVSTRGELVELQFEADGTLLSSEVRAELPQMAWAMAAHPDQHSLYLSFRHGPADSKGQTGQLVHYSRSEEGSLRRTSEIPTYGNSPCHIALAPRDPYLSVTNFRGPEGMDPGNVSIYRLAQDGRPDEVRTLSFEGSGPHERQNGPHPHSGLFADGPLRLYLADYGTDSIWQLDPTTLFQESSTPAPRRHPLPPGTGPRIIADFQNGHALFITTELGKELLWLQPDLDLSLETVSRGSLRVPPAMTNPADVCVSPDYRHVYATNRGSDTLHGFAIDESSTQLQPIDPLPSGGENPRWMAISRNGSLLAVSHPGSNQLRIFRRDSHSGTLQITEPPLSGAGPVIAL